MAAPENPDTPQPPAGGLDIPRGGWPPPSVTAADAMKTKHAETASRLATSLIGILAGSIFLHYMCVLYLVRNQQCDGLKVLGDVFHAWLPVLSGLAGAAATYYFTRDEK